jgi:hypothetical protein
MIGADVTFDGPQPGHEVVEIPRLRAALEVLDVHLVERLIEHRQRHVDSSVLQEVHRDSGPGVPGTVVAQAARQVQDEGVRLLGETASALAPSAETPGLLDSPCVTDAIAEESVCLLS